MHLLWPSKVTTVCIDVRTVEGLRLKFENIVSKSILPIIN